MLVAELSDAQIEQLVVDPVAIIPHRGGNDLDYDQIIFTITGRQFYKVERVYLSTGGSYFGDQPVEVKPKTITAVVWEEV